MYKLSPSDFAYLYQDCKLCFYLKVKHKIYQPSMPMPGVFSAINTRLQTPLVGKNLSTLSTHLPNVKVVNQEGWVHSQLIPQTKVYIKGKYDLLAQNPQHDFTLIDLKISKPQEDKIDKFQTQLNAYRYALVHPASADPVHISRLALLIFYPDQVRFANHTANFTFPPKWLEVPIDEPGFIEFAQEIDRLLQGPPPPENPNCRWCQYRHQGETTSRLSPHQPDLPF